MPSLAQVEQAGQAAVGVLEVAFVGYSIADLDPALKNTGYLLMLAIIGLAGLLSVFRGLWLLRLSLPRWLWVSGMRRF